MATAQMAMVIRHFRRAVLRQDAAGRTDGQLLASFLDQKDEAAFEALVRRHGPMVFGVCHRVVRNHHDAEDAFQATFLVLARKASSVRPRERLANWLRGVALRIAMKAKTITAKRRVREKHVTEMPEPEAAQQDQWSDLQSLLDQELNGLPENYRLPILLCDLEGKTIKEATQQLGWPQGTLAGRLARGRKLLAKRLANRGVVLSAGTLAAVVSQNAAWATVPTSLMSSAVRATAMIAEGQATVAGLVPAKVAALMEGAMTTMMLTKLKMVTAVVLLVATIGIGIAVSRGDSQSAAPMQEQEEPKAALGQEQEQPKDKTKKAPSDKDALKGTWAYTGRGWQGNVTEEHLRKNPEEKWGQVTLSDGECAWQEKIDPDTPQVFRLKYTLETRNGEKWIVIQPKDLDSRAPPIPKYALTYKYLIQGDRLTLSSLLHPVTRPGDFPSPAAPDDPEAVWLHSYFKRLQPKGEQRNKRVTVVSTSQEVHPPKAADQREYVIMSKLLEAGADQPKEVLRLPKATVDEGQLAPLHITDAPQNLLEKVVLDEKIKIGTFFDVRVKRLGGNKVRLFLSFQRNELEKSSVSEIRVLGKSVQAIQDVELHKPVKIVFQKDASGTAQRWVEITVDEQTVPAPADSGPQQKGGKR
jgi:RNA polymerase sigma-70 factor (ECF subfamily)